MLMLRRHFSAWPQGESVRYFVPSQIVRIDYLPKPSEIIHFLQLLTSESSYTFRPVHFLPDDAHMYSIKRFRASQKTWLFFVIPLSYLFISHHCNTIVK